MATAYRTLKPKATPPLRLALTAGSRFLWDGASGLWCDAVLPMVQQQAQPACFQAKRAPASAHQGQPYWSTRDVGLGPTVSPQTIVWEREAARLLFSCALALLADSTNGVVSPTTGTLVWMPCQEASSSPTPPVYPILLSAPATECLQGERITIIPSLRTTDPLFRHIILVLQAAVTAESEAEYVYAEVLTEALMRHFLRRYAASRPDPPTLTGGLVPATFRRLRTYITTHLEHNLSLARLASVAHMSPAHFAHLFKDATGLPPHQYVIVCRMERAKQLLADTEDSLIAIGLQVGYADQSHFSALFRRQVSMTPTAYRKTVRNACV